MQWRFSPGKTNKYLIFWIVSEGFGALVWQGRFVSKAYLLQQQQAAEKESQQQQQQAAEES